jgi:hypothetical protein
MAIQKPYCLAMILCEAVYREPMTGKFTLLGTFGRLTGRMYPIPCVFSVYFCLTDALGEIPIGLKIVDGNALLTDDDIMPLVDVKLPQPVVSNDPLAVIEGIIGISVAFPSSGVYHCELYANDEHLMTRRLLVEGPKEEQGTEDHG